MRSSLSFLRFTVWYSFPKRGRPTVVAALHLAVSSWYLWWNCCRAGDCLPVGKDTALLLITAVLSPSGCDPALRGGDPWWGGVSPVTVALFCRWLDSEMVRVIPAAFISAMSPEIVRGKLFVFFGLTREPNSAKRTEMFETLAKDLTRISLQCSFANLKPKIHKPSHNFHS